MEVIKLLAAKPVSKGKKPWAEMNEQERKLRAKQLWMKVRMFVRMRKVMIKVKNDAENASIEDLLNQEFSEQDDD